MSRWALILLAGAGGAYALSRYGRSRMRVELESFGPEESSAIAEGLSFREALEAGARSLLSGRSFATSGTATIVN